MRALRAFVEAARQRSFTVAADRLGMTPSAISKALSRLEADLGAPLLRRNPRSVVLTAQGVRFLAEAERVLIAVERARSAVSDRSGADRRRLSVALPIHFGRTQITPHLPRFIARHPNLDLDYRLVRNGQVDFAEQPVDFALSVGGIQPVDPAILCRTIASFETLLCAAPPYLDQYGRPDGIDALGTHRTMGGLDEESGLVMPWTFRIGGRAIQHQPRFNIVSNAIEVLLELAVAGTGIAPLPHYLAVEPVRTGRLEPVLPSHRMDAIPVRIAYRRARAADRELTDFIALVSDAVGQGQPTERGRDELG